MKALALALAWLLLVPACSPKAALAKPEPSPEPVPGVTWAYLDHLAGIAYHDCKINPTAWVRVHYQGADLVLFGPEGAVLLTPDLIEVMAHELTHIRQMERLGCEAWAKAMSSLDGRQAIEEEAHCTALWVARRYRCGD